MVPTALIRRRPIEAIVIGGSAGAVAALGEILPGLPADYPPVLIVVHVLATAPSRLADVYRPRCAMRIREAESFEAIERGSVYFAPADYHLLVEADGRCALSVEPHVLFSRPAIDVLFESAALAYGEALAGVVLTGASADGAEGLKAIDAAGGLTFVQEPTTAAATTMPSAAAAAVPSARRLSLSVLLLELQALGAP